MIKKGIELYLLFFVVFRANAQLVHTQMEGSNDFDINTPQLNLPVQFGHNFISTKQYSVWGWFKPTGQNPAISNIVALRNRQGEIIVRQVVDPNFPSCPYTEEELIKDADLRLLPEVTQNPNCNTITAAASQTESLLYVNYDLNPVINGEQTYSLVFLLQKGRSNGISEMTIEGFIELTRTDSWSFFGISADYINGTVSIYLKVFDGINAPLSKTFAIEYPQFRLTRNSELIIGSVDPNPYFDSVSGFIGSIANIEMSQFYTNNLAFMWTGYMQGVDRQYDAVLLDFLFDLYSKEDALRSYGSIQRRFQMVGDYQPIFLDDPSRIGVKFNSNSYLPLNEIDFRNEDNDIQTIAFLYMLDYQENLPDSYVLLTRGTLGENGYMQINLDKKGDGRVLRMLAVAEDGKEVLWENSKTYKPEELYYFIIGLSHSIGGSARTIFIDNQGGNDFSLLSDAFNYDFSPKDITVFSPDNEGPGNGFVNLYRFMTLNSGSAAVNFFSVYSSPYIRDKIQTLPNIQDRLCGLRGSHYEFAGCFLCNQSIANIQRQCIPYCPFGEKNGLTDVCVPCVQNNCDEIDSTYWTLNQIDQENWKLKPSRRILTPNIDYGNLFNISLLGENNSSESFSYSLTPNLENQEVDVKFDYKDDLKEEIISVKTISNPDNPLYDENRNLLYRDVSNVEIDRVCYVSDSREDKMKGLAWTILILFIIALALLLILTVLCCTKKYDLGGIWKFFLHHWMKLQLVAFLLLLAIYMPCCIKAFLHQLYKYAVSWDHELRDWIDDINEDDHDYNDGFANRSMPLTFKEEEIAPFILHNMGIFFIVHLVILFFYIIVKVWDFLNNSMNRSCMYFVFNFMEFTLLIVGYLLVHMQAFVFSAFNFRKAVFDHPYFVICFIIAILYILVFICFWLYAAARLLGADIYLMNGINYNRMYFFLAGYKEGRLARSFDLWVLLAHFIIGMAIGLLYDEALAQIIIILVVLVLLLALTIMIRPWKYLLFNIVDIISQILILIALIIFFIFELWDHGGCEECGDREGALCWLVVLLLFFALLLPLLILALQSILNIFNKKEKIVNVHEEDHYYYDTTNKVVNNYQEVNERVVENRNEMVTETINKEYTTEGMMMEDISDNRRKSMVEFINEAHDRNELDVKNENVFETGENANFEMDKESFTYTGNVIPDEEDEKYLQPNLIEALAKQDHKNDDDEDEAINELEHRKKTIQRKKEEFYSGIQDPDLMVNEIPGDYDEYKVIKEVVHTKKIVNGELVQEEPVIDSNTYEKKVFKETIEYS